MKHALLLVSLGLLLLACAPDPRDVGLISVRPYPGAESQCQVIGENDRTREYLGDASILIGCPTNEKAAITARLGEGGQIVGRVQNWTLISVPLR